MSRMKRLEEAVLEIEWILAQIAPSHMVEKLAEIADTIYDDQERSRTWREAKNGARYPGDDEGAT